MSFIIFNRLFFSTHLDFVFIFYRFFSFCLIAELTLKICLLIFIINHIILSFVDKVNIVFNKQAKFKKEELL